MLLLGLTGSIATGKSLVAEAFRDVGAVVIDADRLARRVVEPGSPGLSRVAARFGPGVLTPAGELDRPALRRLIFADPQAKADLEAILHPLILAAQEAAIQAATEADPQAVVVVDLPLLFEVGAQDRFDQVVVVYLDRATQLARLQARDGLSEAQAAQAVASQMDLEAKRAQADHVIDNRGAPEEIRAQVARLYARLKKVAQA